MWRNREFHPLVTSREMCMTEENAELMSDV